MARVQLRKHQESRLINTSTPNCDVHRLRRLMLSDWQGKIISLAVADFLSHTD